MDIRRYRQSVSLVLVAGMLAFGPVTHTQAAEFTERCAGYGNRNTAYLMDWEAGLGAWSVSQSGVANPATFDTPDWSVMGSLPDGRAGSAAFVADRVAGDCATDDETGLLRLQSPSIVIPAGADVPRVSVDHWFETEPEWDGGQIRVRVNGGSWTLLPPSAFEQFPHNATLQPAVDEFGVEWNTNPLAGQSAFSGTIDGHPTGQWVQSRINLLGIADAGDSVEFRFDFGIDICTVSPEDAVGWFVDDFELYHCEAELPASNCGNGVINDTEECDDGNRMIGDGCSNACIVESDWSCELPTASSPVDDYSFEAGTPNPVWTEYSDSSSGTPICSEATCNKGGGTGPAHGNYWAKFGNVAGESEGSLSQSLTIPTSARTLAFQLEIPRCDTAADYLEVLIDGNQELLVTGEDPACEILGYQTRTIDITQYADGGVHTVEFHSQTFGNGGQLQTFFVDVVELPANPSFCRLDGTSLVLKKRVFNDNGGQAYPPDWTLEASGPSFVSGQGPVVLSGDGFLPGTYDLSESGPTGYANGGWFCKGGTQLDSDTVTVATDEAVVCTLENADIAPTLTVVKTINNDNGGDIVDPDLFQLEIDYEGVLHDSPATVMSGDHRVSEKGLFGYQAGSWGGDCAADGSIMLNLGQDATCTITNDDMPASLTLFKSIVNDDDGTVSDPNAFVLQVDGTPVIHGIAASVNAGTRQASELGLPGYVAGDWGGDCNPDGSITLALAQEANCTVTNNDVDRTQLDLVIQVVNDDGGTEIASAWQLVATGPAGFSGPGPSVSSGQGLPPGSYDLSVSGPDVYTTGDWVCSGGTQNDADTVTLAIDEAATCTVTVNDIAPTIKVIKNIVNDDGGTVEDPNAFGLRVDGIAVSHDVPTSFDAGMHTVSELGLPGYAAGNWSGHCAPDGSITLELAQDATCIISNNDIAPTITVLKTIINDNGGTISNPSLFGLKVDGIAVSHGVPKAVSVGMHTVSETGSAGYQPGTWGGDCAADGLVTVELGESAVCTISNDDIAPTLTVLKTVQNDDQGTITDPDAFGLKVDGNPVLHGVANVLDAGNHLVSETPVQGYEASFWGGDCDLSGNVHLDPGENATCTITNDDSGNTQLTLIKSVNNNAGGGNSSEDWTLTATGPSSFSGPGPTVASGPGLTPGSYDLSESGPAGYEAGDWDCAGGTQVDGDTISLELGETASCFLTNDDIAPTITLVKSIINDNGGTVTDPNAFGLMVDGDSASHNVPFTTYAGSHTVSIVGVAGYESGTWGGDCAGDGSITLSVGQEALCTIESDDISPRLTVDKTVTNDGGGEVTDPNAFGLQIDGQPAQDETEYLVDAGNHVVSEDGLPGYVPGTWGGDCNPDGSITLALAEVATCTITNDDVDITTLTLVKQVINNNGGSASGSDWTLNANGPGSFGGPGPSVTGGPGLAEGTYDLSESGGPGGYEASDWVCNGGTQVDGDTITLAGGDVVTCTITNNDTDTTGLTLVLDLTNDSGGVASATEWTLSATGPTGFSGAGPSVANGSPFSAGSYDLSFSGPPGYSMSTWGCVGATQDDNDTVSLALGDVATCTIQADDAAAQLTLLKTIINNNGGNVVDPDAFGLRIDDALVSHGVPVELDAGAHTVSEDGLAGYLAGSWGGDCAPDGSITLELGELAECTVTNDDIAASLTVVNTVTNDNGGTVDDPNAFVLRVDGGVVSNGAANSLEAGPHTVSQDGQPSYSASTWGGDCAPDGSIALALAQSATCTITNDDTPPTLTLAKVVTNDDGGTAAASAWTLSAAGLSPFNGPGPSVSSGPTFQAGSYDLSESGGVPGYEASSWVCAGGTQNDSDTVTLAIGETATCTITNDDIGATLTLVNTVVNDDGGTVDNPNAFGLTIDAGAVLNNTPAELDAGPHTAGITGLFGYESGAWGGDCAPDGSITLELAQNATCDITSDDVAPLLTVNKNVINDNGGTVNDPDAFGLKVNGAPVSHGVASELVAGNHLVSEDGQDGYEAGAWGGDCFPDGSISLSVGDEATCSITNDDREPGLTLVKEVINTHGGSATPSEWTISATGPGILSGPGPSVSSGPGFKAGTYTLAQSGGPTGYDTGDWVCVGGTQTDAVTVSIDLGETATCTITSHDIAPTLTLLKTVTNDNGGTVTDPDAFGLKIDGMIVLHGAQTVLDAGMHTASENGLPGYQAQSWGGDCATNGSIDLEVGQDKTCTLTNDDKAPSLTLVNNVSNDNGGTASGSDWTLAASGPTGFSGPGPTVSNGAGFEVGTYDLSATGGPPGYTAGNWNCIGGNQVDGDTVILDPGATATCHISHDDNAPSLTLVKEVVNNSGGTAQPSDWILLATGPSVFNGPGPSVSSGAGFDAGIYTLSETGDDSGYSASAWTCIGGTQGGDTITLDLGETATCTIVNTDIAPTLTLLKTVLNDNGGTITDPDAFELTIDGQPALHGQAVTLDAGPHTASETSLPGYLPGDWGGDCNADGTIDLSVGQDATCTITNDDTEPGLTLVIEVTSDNGGTATAGDWTLVATGPTGFSGPGPSVSNGPDFEAGTYDLSTSGGADGYDAQDWICNGGTQDDADTITLQLGEAASCTLAVNDASPALTLVKVVTNDHGGTAAPTDWTLSAAGPTAFSGPGPDVSNPAGFHRGTYDLSESGGPDGYSASDWACAGGTQPDGDTVELELGESATCTLTNDDIEPALTLVKEVINDHGGTREATDWTLHASGPAGFSGPGPSVSNGSNFQAGSYDLSETGDQEGYSASDWNCDGGVQSDGDTLILAPGETVTCTITNNDIGPGLTLVKQVVNNNGGPGSPSDWMLTATGPTGFSGPGPSVTSDGDFEAGTYGLFESGEIEGYTASAWVCDGGTMEDDFTVTVAPGEIVSCTITNSDTGYSPILFKDGFEGE